MDVPAAQGSAGGPCALPHSTYTWHDQSAVVIKHASTFLAWNCLQAKSKSRQENYFSLLAKSRSGPARDISVDFGSSTGLMSRQARGTCVQCIAVAFQYIRQHSGV